MPSAPQSAPHNTEAERMVIGALLIDPDRIVEVVGTLTPLDFYDSAYRKIYTVVVRLYEARSPIDFVTVTNALKDEKWLQDIGGSAFLADLAANVPTASHAEHYA